MTACPSPRHFANFFKSSAFRPIKINEAGRLCSSRPHFRASWRHIGIRRVASRCFPSDQQRASGWRHIIWSTHIVLLAACVVAIINISARPVSKNQAQRKETWKPHRKLRERRGDDGLRSVLAGRASSTFRAWRGSGGPRREEYGLVYYIAWHFRKHRTLAGRICSLESKLLFSASIYLRRLDQPPRAELN